MRMQELASGAEIWQAEYERGWTPEPRQTVSEWADANVILGNRGGPAAIRFRSDVTPYLREPMDALGPRSSARRVVLCFGTQLGKTTAGNNALAFTLARSPCAMLVVMPTIELARRFSRQRLDPMINTTPALAGLVDPPRSRDSGNTLLSKEFPGGVLFLTGANSASGVKQMPIRWLFCDEVDEYPGDIDGQGDPIALAEQRLTGPTFTRRKELLCSTPTIKGLSRIEREYLASDQRRYFVPCPHCGHMDVITWKRIKYEKGNPQSAALLCFECGTLIDEYHKRTFLREGQWRPTAEGDGETIGFHLSSLYSPLGWLPWSACVSLWMKAQKDKQRLKAFVNSVLAETYEDRDDTTVDPETLEGRREKYAAMVPDGVGVLVASVDVQGDRLEMQVKGYGAAQESWLIAFEQIFGDPSQAEVWKQLDVLIQSTYQHQSGREVPISCVTVDSGGHHTDQVYRFCRPREKRLVFAIKGGSARGEPLVSRPRTRNRYKAKLFTLCVDTGKETVLKRLTIGAPGPGYCHLPDWLDEEYIRQLTAERPHYKYSRHRGTVRTWVKIRDRNEALDLEVYSLAALHILGAGLIKALPERAAALSRPIGEDGAPAQEEGKNRMPIPRPKGWVGGWQG